MNALIAFDENLSEEILDENVSVSSVNVSPNIAKNMSKPLFSHKIGLLKENTFKKSLFFKSKLSVSPSQPTFQQGNFLTTRAKQTNFANFSEACSAKSNLQSDIKSLLQKAIKIRTVSNSEREGIAKPQPMKTRKRPSKAKIVKRMTIHDCESPNCFQ